MGGLVVAVHGGAGFVPMEERAARAAACRQAACLGLEVLERGGRSLDAAQRAVEHLEDEPAFNAGTGAVPTEDGTLELDAALMEGTELRFGAVAVLGPFRHPIRVARGIMDDGRHAFLAGAGADSFARTLGEEELGLERMLTAEARARLAAHLATNDSRGSRGTVGAVACDATGRVAAATSTGGMIGQRAGRVGDSPLPGAGTWADDERGACSATGTGELILRFGLARAACDLLTRGVTPDQAAERAIATLGGRLRRGEVGLILVDPRGRAAACWDTDTMSYAIAASGAPVRASA